LSAGWQRSTAAEALLRLQELEDKWGQDYPTIVKSWCNNWERIVPFFEYPPEIRRTIYTTNAIESVNMSLRKVTKSRGSSPIDEALLKLFYLRWTTPAKSGWCRSEIGKPP
jgi:putative transposase